MHRLKSNKVKGTVFRVLGVQQGRLTRASQKDLSLPLQVDSTAGRENAGITASGSRATWKVFVYRSVRVVDS